MANQLELAYKNAIEQELDEAAEIEPKTYSWGGKYILLHLIFLFVFGYSWIDGWARIFWQFR